MRIFCRFYRFSSLVNFFSIVCVTVMISCQGGQKPCDSLFLSSTSCLSRDQSPTKRLEEFHIYFCIDTYVRELNLETFIILLNSCELAFCSVYVCIYICAKRERFEIKQQQKKKGTMIDQ